MLSIANAWPTAARETNTTSQPSCHYIYTDAEWPDETAWDQLNQTVNSRLIRGVPLGQPCYSSELNADTCSRIRDEWTSLDIL